MKNFELLEHKADVRVRIFGNFREDIFAGALLAMKEILSSELLDKEVSREIKLESPDTPTLLVDFLNEALFLGQTNRKSYHRVNLTLRKGNVLEDDLFGHFFLLGLI